MATSCVTSTRGSRRRTVVSVIAAAALLAECAGAVESSEHPADAHERQGNVNRAQPSAPGRSTTRATQASSGRRRSCSRPGTARATTRRLPVVISPHGRGATGPSNAKFFDRMPAIGRFALISPDGMGRRLKRFSYGYAGQIDDLAKMPDFAENALPWLHLDRSRIFALGSSMGGQETLLLVARHPRLLAGAAAMDSVTDLGRRHDQLPALPCDSRCLARWGKPTGVVLQSTMEREVGGGPTTSRRAYESRSALSQVGRIARSGVPLQLWWSTQDKIVFDQKHQSEALLQELRRLDPCAPVSAYVGRWAHSTEMRASALLPIALSHFGLLPAKVKALPRSVRHTSTPSCS